MEMFLNGFVLGVLTVGIGSLYKIAMAEYELNYRKRKARIKAQLKARKIRNKEG